MDRISPEQRRRNMAAVRGKNTKPELAVRKALHALGYRFRLHRKGLPGKPDIVLPKHKIAIFVNGCFWHRHEGCKHASTPSTNVDFWLSKFKENTTRDKRNYELLQNEGWRVVIIWECEIPKVHSPEWIKDLLSKQ